MKTHRSLDNFLANIKSVMTEEVAIGITAWNSLSLSLSLLMIFNIFLWQLNFLSQFLIQSQ